MSGGRKTESFYGIKTREIVVQNADGTFPDVGTVLTIIDDKGHTTWLPGGGPAPVLYKTRYFTFSNQDATGPATVPLTWPAATWPETGQIDLSANVPSWICSVVGIVYNYGGDTIVIQQITGLCTFTPGVGWFIKRTMIDAFGATSGLMGFHIMAMPADIADDRR